MWFARRWHRRQQSGSRRRSSEKAGVSPNDDPGAVGGGGIDRTSFYDWKRRFQLHGLDRLQDLPAVVQQAIDDEPARVVGPAAGAGAPGLRLPNRLRRCWPWKAGDGSDRSPSGRSVSVEPASAPPRLRNQGRRAMIGHGAAGDRADGSADGTAARSTVGWMRCRRAAGSSAGSSRCARRTMRAGSAGLRARAHHSTLAAARLPTAARGP